jgi:hypothetical protein
MSEADPADVRVRVEEAQRVRDARAERDAALTPAERLARVDALCRQLAAIRPVRPPQA